MFSNQETQLAYNQIFGSGYWTRDLDKVQNVNDLINLYLNCTPDCEVPYIDKIKFEEILEVVVR